MQVTFHLPINVVGSPGRTTNKRTVVGYVPVASDIPVLSSHEAPVALRFNTSDKNGFVNEEELRSHEGNLLRAVPDPVCDVVATTYRRHGRAIDGLFSERLNSIADIIKGIRSESRSIATATALAAPASFAGCIAGQEDGYEFEPILAMTFNGGVESQIDEQVVAFRKKIAGLVIVDGTFYTPEPEPVLRMTGSFDDIFCRPVRGKEARECGLMNGDGRDQSILGYFRMDQGAEMIEEAQGLVTGGRVVVKPGNIEVYDPSILVANVEAMSLAELAATFSSYLITNLVEPDATYGETIATLAKGLTALPPSQLALFQMLSKGIELFKTTGDTSVLEGSVLSITESSPQSIERFHFVFPGNVERYAAAITRRWNDREVSLARDLRVGAPSPASHR
jgi:hypothetical protein